MQADEVTRAAAVEQFAALLADAPDCAIEVYAFPAEWSNERAHAFTAVMEHWIAAGTLPPLPGDPRLAAGLLDG